LPPDLPDSLRRIVHIGKIEGMIEPALFNSDKSLQELEGKDWGEPTYDSHLVVECHRLRRVPLREFTAENLRIMIGQQIGLLWLVPLALGLLERDPFAEGDFYKGDLLAAVLRVDASFWQNHPRLRQRTIEVMERAYKNVVFGEGKCHGFVRKEWGRLHSREAVSLTCTSFRLFDTVVG
jgi:hypothetical protein